MPSVHERAPGVFTIRVNNGHDPLTGRRHVHTETFRGSRRAATSHAQAVEREVKANAVAKGDTPLRKVIAEWRDTAGHADGTMRNYDLAERTIPNHLMKTPVAKIRTETLRQLNAKVLADHGIERTRLVHAVISGALSYAWRHEWIAQNVALKVIPPAPRRRKDTTPTADELARLLELVKERPELYAWILVSAMVGGRPSEILALRWSDVKFDPERTCPTCGGKRWITDERTGYGVHDGYPCNACPDGKVPRGGQITISKALNPIGGGLKTTKTDNERTVAIGTLTVAALWAWHDRFHARAREVGAKPVADPFVFVRPRTWDGGTPWRPDYGSKEFRKLRDRAGINPLVRRYDVRHYVATTLLDQGVPLKTVGDRLGHTRHQTTADTYGHRVHASDQLSASILERGLVTTTGET